MKKYISNFSILVSSVVFLVAVIGTAAAQSSGTSSDAFSNLTYPIAELGNCKDRNDCKIYCDDSANTAACINYAEKKNLLSEEELKVAKNFIASGSKGPGECKGKKECQAYCEDKNHIDECVSYAETNGLMSGEELQKAKKVQTAIKNGVKFPSCQNKTECDAYCEDSSHMEECIAFAKEAGLLSDKELQNSQKVLTAVKQGVKQPPCKGKDACDIYCTEASHAEECVNFAVAAGIVTSDEVRIIKETGGKGPGGCKNKSECDSYCGNDANREACMSFAKEHNIPQPLQQPGTGPGNGAGQGQGGPGAGAGPGNGAGQGGGTPGSGLQESANPTKCIAECEAAGKDCISALGSETKRCASEGQYCRQITCSQVDAEGNPPKQEIYIQCNNSLCTPREKICNDAVTAADAACRTKKDVCVMDCQKASKPTKPTPPTQPTTPGTPGTPGTPPTPPTQPTQPGQPGQSQPTFSQSGPGGCKTVDECRAYCQSHPEAQAACQQFKASQKPALPAAPTPPQPSN